MSKAFSVSQSQIDKRKKLLEKMANAADMQTSNVPFIEEQKQPLHSQANIYDSSVVSSLQMGLNGVH